MGALSPMNAKNNLRSPKFFIPDPWTDTPTDGSWVSNFLDKALKQSVNDNASGKITIKTLFYIISSSLYLLTVKDLWSLFQKFFWAIRRGYRKSIFLDLFLSKNIFKF